MKSNNATPIGGIALLAALVLPVLLAAQAQQVQRKQPPFYAVTDLGTLGGTFGLAYRINNSDAVAGWANLAEDAATHAFLWQGGLTSDLGTFGGINSLSFGLNGNGLVVGRAESPVPDPFGVDFCFTGTQLQCLPFLWQNGAMTALPTLGGNNGVAFGINDTGVAAGQAENSILDSTCGNPQYEAKPVVWKDGVVQELPTLSGDPDGYASEINNYDQAVGASFGCSSPPLHALLWQNGGVTDLGNLGGELYSEAFAINDRGQVVGSSDLPGDTNIFAGPYSTAHGFLWKNGRVHDLGVIPGDGGSFAFGINNHGQVVGAGSRAILWQNHVLTDINTLVPGDPFSSLYLLGAFDINDRGEIVGLGLAISGELHAFLATPCDKNHADFEGCQNGGAIPAEMVPAQAAPTSASTTRPNPGLGGALGQMLDRFRTRSFSHYQFPRPEVRPVNQR
jgi:probable HAF family extracellular repeat protein